ncbi:unnamed protein product [Ambrosiozyma monospora]|uniref:Unnamed protein product n=1 Tax=Ambrosiozyma monospora TaxID=43982 RepID=A0ACB5T929_AMBMO|nr:unnamed protein product [Ambrosiozyma monospora]
MSAQFKAPQLYKIDPLTTEEIDFLKSLAPAVKENGVTVTSTMYNHMFATYPQVKPFFNMTNQHTKRQPKVLAFSLYAYLTHLDDLAPIAPFVHQIVVKHCGLAVEANQYPVVEKCLTYAFGKVFGDVLDDHFYKVFSKAYGNLAQLLIDAEWAHYHTEMQWVGFKDVKVTKLEKECEDVTSVYLTPVDGTQLKPALPGQYLGLRWAVGDHPEVSREYSISDTFQDDNTFRISVRLIPNGFISTYVNEQLKVGDVIKTVAPVGNFIYKKDSPKEKVALFAGGIGITPLISIAETALADGKSIKFFYSNRKPTTIAFKSWFDDLQTRFGKDRVELHSYVSSEGEKLKVKDIDTVDDSYETYLLGPVEYMDFVKAELEKIGVKNVNLEYFGPTNV